MGIRSDHPKILERSLEFAYLNGVWDTLMHEEFPEGPYGSTLFPHDKPGKATPWEANQQVVSRFKDENPAFTEGLVPAPGDQPEGSQI